MKHIEVLGFGCTTCDKTFARIREQASRRGIAVCLEKVSDPARMAGYGLLRPPGVAVDGRLVFSGGVPDDPLVASWLAD